MNTTPDCQDWTPIVIGSRKIKHTHYNPSKKSTTNTLSNDVVVPKKVLSSESRKELVAKRLEKGWNQIQLNNNCALPSNMIRDIEAGHVCPSPAQLNILNRILKSSLHYAH